MTPHVTQCIRHYATYIITVVGCISNIIILIVLLNSRRMRKSVSGVFLIAVAIADIIVLLSEQVIALSRNRLYHELNYTASGSCPSKGEVIPADPALCSATAYFKYTFRCLSTFLILGISAHRFIVMKFPLTFRKVSNLRVALAQIAILVAISLLVNLYAVAIDFASTMRGCEPIDHDKVYSTGVTIVIVVICDNIGSLLISILSIWSIRIYINAGKHFLQRQDSSTSQSRRDGERHMTVLLLTVALTFVIMRLPYTITWLPLWFKPKLMGTPLEYANNITYCIYLSKHAIKLYLYCICSHGFREEFRFVALRARRRSTSSSGSRSRCGTGSNTTLSRVIASKTV